MKATCAIGGEEIDSGYDEEFHYTYKGKPCCREHYYEKLGELVEEHPIGIPKRAHHCFL